MKAYKQLFALVLTLLVGLSVSTVANAQSCSGTATFNVTIKPLPTAVILINGNAVSSFQVCGTTTVNIGSQVTGGGYTYQWYRNGNLTNFTGASKNNFNLPTGTYRVRVTKTSTGCSALSAPVVITCPGASEKTIDDLFAFGAPQPLSLELYPNPANTHATVLYQVGDDVSAKLALYDLMGRLVMNEVELRPLSRTIMNWT